MRLVNLQVGWNTLHEEFGKLMDREDRLKEHDNIFDQLKLAVKDASRKRHEWDVKAEESLVSFPATAKCYPFIYSFNNKRNNK